MTRHLLLVAALGAIGLAPAAVVAQDAAIQGIIAEQETGRPLEGVAVILEAGGEQAYGTLTDRNGFYQIPGITPGSYTLRSQIIGYEPHVEPLTLAADERRTVSLRLEPSAVVLEDIVVSPERGGAAVRDLGRQVVMPGDLRMVPLPAGSGDLATYLQTLPGVTTTGDRGGQLFVRGGTPADNLVLVDGIPIYQPFHILGFFSVFPEDLISRADFYAGGFGARYHGRSSSVLDVRIREGEPGGFRAVGSASPFVAEALVEGSTASASWIGSVRRSLFEETSGTLIGTTQPLTFESELFKVTSTLERDDRCSALVLRTRDRGRLDPQERSSEIAWRNFLFGLQCFNLRSSGQLVEMHWSYTSSGSDAVSRGSSDLDSKIWRVQHDLHLTGSLGAIPIEAGYETYVEGMSFDLAELFSNQAGNDNAVFGSSLYAEAALPLGSRIEMRPGLVLVGTPQAGIEPRLRASWEPLGRPSEKVQGALGVYRQNLVGTSDMRDVGSVFVAWMTAPDDVPLDAVHGTLGWQQALGDRFRWSVDGYYKRMKGIPVPVWRGVAQFTTELGRADGEVRGVDFRLDYTAPRFFGYLGYGYSSTRYESRQEGFGSWFGEPVQSYHPPHDRRHQLNAVASVDIGEFRASARWQFGSGLPFTRPLGFDEAFDYTRNLYDVHKNLGATRLVLDRPFTGRLPAVHRLDVSVERGFDLSVGRLVAQAGVINGYDRRNMFYYDLFTGRRLDQLPLTPYLSVTLRGR